MRDPELVQRAERAAMALEQALIRWRERHGLDDEPLQPVTSYVGYSATEPWGQPRVVLGVHAEEAERLTAILEGHDCIGPVHAGISGWPARRQTEATWTSVSGLPLSRTGSTLPPGVPIADGTAAAVPAVPFIAPANETAVPDLEPLPPQEIAVAEPAPPSGGATAEQFAGPAATWSELVGHEQAGYEPMAQELVASREPEAGDEPTGRRPASRPRARGERPVDQPRAAEPPIDEAAAGNTKPAAPRAAPARRRVVAPRPRTSPDDSSLTEQPPDRGSAPKWQGSPAAKRTKTAEPAKDRPARTRTQSGAAASKSTRTRRTTQRPAAGNWPAVDGNPSAADKSM